MQQVPHWVKTVAKFPVSLKLDTLSLKLDTLGVVPRTFDSEDHAVNHSTTFLIEQILCNRCLIL